MYERDIDISRTIAQHILKSIVYDINYKHPKIATIYLLRRDKKENDYSAKPKN